MVDAFGLRTLVVAALVVAGTTSLVGLQRDAKRLSITKVRPEVRVFKKTIDGEDIETFRRRAIMVAATRHGGTPWWQDPVVLDAMYGR